MQGRRNLARSRTHLPEARRGPRGQGSTGGLGPAGWDTAGARDPQEGLGWVWGAATGAGPGPARLQAVLEPGEGARGLHRGQLTPNPPQGRGELPHTALGTGYGRGRRARGKSIVCRRQSLY